MLYQIITTILDPKVIFMTLVALAAFATVMTIMLPAMSRDRIGSRMKVMATQRDEMRRERMAELAAERGTTAASLRQRPKGYMQRLVDQFDFFLGLVLGLGLVSDRDARFVARVEVHDLARVGADDRVLVEVVKPLSGGRAEALDAPFFLGHGLSLLKSLGLADDPRHLP